MKNVRRVKSGHLLLRQERDRCRFKQAVLMILFLICFSPAFAERLPVSGIRPLKQTTQQTKRISGTVLDSRGETIPGVAIVVKGTTTGTVSDADGQFSLEVPSDAILVVSYIGMKTEEISVGRESTFTITLSESNIGLEEVIVVGYGTQKKATLTGSISQIGGEELKKVSSVNLTNSLGGKMAGVISNVRSGEPGSDDAQIKIRGAGTFGSTNPLIVVDGVADRDFSRLNPEDIESISVLKDASAAIYGARAANGVILVTTKRGQNNKTSVSYSGNVGFSQPTKVPDMLNAYQYGTYANEYRRTHGEAETFTQDQLNAMRDGTNPDKFPDTNWWDAVSNDWATKTTHSLSVSGGNDKISFYTSGQYMWQDAIYKKSAQDYSQFQLTSNIDAKVGKSIRIGLDVMGRQEKRNRGSFDTGYLFDFMMKAKPIAAPYYTNGLPRVGAEWPSTNAAIMVTDIPGTNEAKYHILNIKPTVRIDLDAITQGLYVEGYAAIDFSFRNGKKINHPYDIYELDDETGEYKNRRDGTGNINVESWSDNSSRITLNARIGYSRVINGAHKVDAFVAYEQSKYRFDYVSAYRKNFISTAIPEIFAGSSNPEDWNTGGYANATARQNYFGRINYGYNDKYLAEFTMRYDGSMNFAPGHRWGLFPAFSLGWVISEESFFDNLRPVINFLKLKGSWGMMGNDDITAYQYMSQFKFINGDDPFQSNGAMFGDGVEKGLYLARTANPLVTWETARTTNIGFSAQFLDGKFALDADYFFSKRNDILLTRSASIPIYSGLTLPAENIGKVNNRGVELIASYMDRKGDFSWGVSGNFTFAKNEVVYMDEAATTPDYQRTTGRTMGGMLLYDAIGIYQTQQQVDETPHIDGAQVGDLIYRDVDGDGKITELDRVRVNETATPRIMYGFTLNGGWKGVDLNVFFQGQAQAKQLIMPTMNMLTDFYEGRWIDTNSAEENAKARWPRACINDSGYMDTFNGKESNWWLRNAAFLRLKSIELGYTLPKTLCSKMNVDRACIFVNGSNLFTFDKIDVCDPEAASYINDDGNLVNSGGILGYPLNRTITFGMNITF